MAPGAKGKNSRAYLLNWRKVSGKRLITNDFGYFRFLSEKEFTRLMSGTSNLRPALHQDLSKKGFVRNWMDFDSLSETWRLKNAFLHFGPGLHIFVITLRCNYNCLYCQSGALPERVHKTDMSFETARRAVDIAFQSPAPSITIEFQGGEPLLNWKTLKKTIEYARKKEVSENKELSLALVTNFSLMDAEKAEFLLANEVSLCTSLDGPRKVHDRNRPYSKGSSYDLAVKWIKYFMRRHDTQKGGSRIFKPSALLTVTRFVLRYPEETVDEYVKLGLEDIFVRPMSPIGYAARVWDKIGYNSREFLSFYGKVLEYILKLNEKGVRIREKNASLLLEKILNRRDPGYLDLRYPCGAAVGQIAYNWDGGLYTCDEGRMIAQQGDDVFRIGTVHDEYESIVKSGACRLCALSSNLEQQPVCFRCAYKPYCGVCPVYNHEAQKSVWGNMLSNERCAIFMGIFDLIFKFLQDKKKERILKKWIPEK